MGWWLRSSWENYQDDYLSWIVHLSQKIKYLKKIFASDILKFIVNLKLLFKQRQKISTFLKIKVVKNRVLSKLFVNC